ncbi:succinate dehydrogenase, cytochrome b556 subunit [Sulfurivermis fontis]|uniref:succinate dehydrogenase, cytochrome b556 subunit n=1 Tax=Sulfurivermis fontis TaxID=1972068 RepID=UPI000FD76B91|nr:succinate dehydrogenase, cytochrome b556 subunit [Sulfurivermis fontis]
MTTPHQRPVFFHLLQLHLPLTALVSIVHRLTGLLLFLALAPAIWLLERSLRDAAGYVQVQQLLQTWPARLLGVLLLWALAHHLLAGLRVLLIDAGFGVERGAARHSALWVFAAGMLAVIAGVLWP